MSSLIKDVHDALYAISSFPSILSIPRRTVEGRTDIQGGNGSLAQIKISEDAKRLEPQKHIPVDDIYKKK